MITVTIALLVGLTLWVVTRVFRGTDYVSTLSMGVLAAAGWANIIDRATRTEGPLPGPRIGFITIAPMPAINIADVLTIAALAVWIVAALVRRQARSRHGS